MQMSPDIVIAKCTSTYGSKPTAKPVPILDGVIFSDIQVVSVLKGNTKPGPSRLASWYWPYPDQQFVIFGSYESDRYSTNYTAIEGYKIVPLSRNFPLHTLDGKTLDEQLQLIFSNRVSDLNEEIGQDEKEKTRLEEYLKK